MNIKNNKIDKMLYKIISRKLLVFILATIFFTLSMMQAEQWLTLAVAYIGMQTVSDTIVRIKGAFGVAQKESEYEPKEDNK